MNVPSGEASARDEEDWVVHQVERFLAAALVTPGLEVSAFLLTLGDAPGEHLEALRRRLSAVARLDEFVAGFDRASATQPGMHIAGFKVLQRLGSGGMGLVLEAWDEQLRRVVALKMVLSAAGSVGSLRLRREAEAIAALRHPNLVTLHGVVEHEGMPVLVLERVDGESLQEILTRVAGTAARPPANGALLGRAWCSWNRAVAEVVSEVLDGLAAAHERNIVHRDLKPANILIDRSGRVRIIDFGLARLVDATTLTMAGALLGTPSYLTPEYLNDRSNVGTWTDVYAVGVVLYQMLALMSPFGDEATPVVLARIRTGDCRPAARVAPGVSPQLSAIAEKAMAALGTRYPSAAAFREDLRRYLDGGEVAARPAGVVQRMGRRLRRRPDLAALALVAVLGGAVSVLWGQFAVAGERLRSRDLVTRSLAQWAAWRESGRFEDALAAMGDFDAASVPAGIRDEWTAELQAVTLEARLARGVAAALDEEDLSRVRDAVGQGGTPRSATRPLEATSRMLVECLRDCGLDLPAASAWPPWLSSSPAARDIALTGVHALLMTRVRLREGGSTIPVEPWFDAVDRIDPDEVRSMFRASVRVGDWGEAARLASSATSVPLPTVAVEHLAELLCAVGRGGEAHELAMARRIVSRTDWRAQAFVARAWTYNWLGTENPPSSQLVLESWLGARALAPASGVIAYQVAVTLFRMGRVAQAELLAREAVARHPGEPRFRMGLAQILMYANKPGEALPHFQWLLAQAPALDEPGVLANDLGKAIVLSGGSIADGYPHFAAAFTAAPETFRRDMCFATAQYCEWLLAAGRYEECATAWLRIDGVVAYSSGLVSHLDAAFAAFAAAGSTGGAQRDSWLEHGVRWLAVDTDLLQRGMGATSVPGAIRELAEQMLRRIEHAHSRGDFQTLPVAVVAAIDVLRQQAQQLIQGG